MSTFDFNGLFDKLEYPKVINANARQLTDIARKSLQVSLEKLDHLKEMRRTVQDRLYLYASFEATPGGETDKAIDSLTSYDTGKMIEAWQKRIEAIDFQVAWQEDMVKRYKDNLDRLSKQQEEATRAVVEILREGINDYRNSRDTS